MILPHVEIIRLEDAFPEGTFGALLIATKVFCWTLEPPEFDNMKDFACIPPGQYECSRIRSNKFGINVYKICNIPNRTKVEIHPGNTVDDTIACVLLGETLAKLRGKRAILNSGKTHLNFMNMMNPYEDFRLTIKESWA